MPEATRVSLINEAITRIGGTPIEFAEETDEDSDTLVAIYETRVETLFSLHPWKHSKRGSSLGRMPSAQLATWRYSYNLPSGISGHPYTLRESASLAVPPLKRFELSAAASDGAQVVNTDAEAVWIFFTQRTPPAVWPGYFRELALKSLAAAFAIPVREDPVLAKSLEELAFGPAAYDGQGGWFAIAKRQDSQGDPSPIFEMEDGPLIEARY